MNKTKDFILKAEDVHNNKYDYSKVNYINSKTKVCIVCPEHGEFWMTPNNHLRKHGCPKCGKICYIEKRKKNTEEFIKKARQVHGNKYDYSKVEYKNSKTKVCIICPEHGEFWQKAGSHINGCGCPKCAKNYIQTKEEFIKKAKKVHGDKYDYSKVEYVNNHTKVCITCPIHGEFSMYPENHINSKQGCPKCGNLRKGLNKKSTTEDFILRARQVHDWKYDYSKVEYINANTKVCIICPEHGEFWQTPTNHLRRQGCPKCVKNHKLTKEEFIKRSIELHKNKYDYSKTEYININTPTTIICKEHGEFKQKPINHLTSYGCPLCGLKRNLTEQKILSKIKNDFPKIRVEYQKKLEWLGRQSLDIYLPDFKIGIEIQGEQHFIPKNFFGGISGLNKIINRDKKKKELCDKNNVIILYYIPLKYYKYNEFYSKNCYCRYDRLVNKIKKLISNKNKSL